MSIFVEHPKDWIGIPEIGVGQRWEQPDRWANDLLDEITAGEAVTAEQRAALLEVLVFIAATQEKRGSSGSFITLIVWSGPIYLVDMILQSRRSAGSISLEDYAGASAPDVAEPPLVEPFATNSGLQGVRCIRYVVPEEQPPGIIACVDYAWEIDDSLLRLYAATYDLVDFERGLPLFDTLAATVRQG